MQTWWAEDTVALITFRFKENWISCNFESEEFTAQNDTVHFFKRISLFLK